jgi:mannosyl-oligosaccharide alpha-1,2-mannosidase
VDGNANSFQAYKAETHLIHPKPAPYYPGLVGSQVDTNTGEFLDYNYGWQSGVDSFLEVSNQFK